MTAPLTSVDTAPVAFPAKRKHRWIKWDTHLLPDASASGCEEHRSTCQHCRIVKTTFIPPTGNFRDIYRRWVMPDGRVFEYQPPCTGLAEGLPE